MSYYLDVQYFVAIVKTKQGSKTLRDLSEEISFPDMPTFFLICDWLELHPKEFIREGREFRGEKQLSAFESIEIELRLSSLDKDFTDGLIKIIRAYNSTNAKKEQCRQ